MRSKHTTKHKSRLRLVTPRKPRPDPDRIDALAPAGYRQGDQTIALTPVDNAFAWAGLYEGDTAVMYGTSDVTPEDLAAIEIDGHVWLGRYRPAPGGYFTVEADGETERFKPGEALLLGRVCHFERRGEIVRTFRPIR